MKVWCLSPNLLISIFIINLNVLPAWGYDTLSEARQYIEQYYLNPVPDSVLNASTIDAMVKGLNDPYSEYFTAEEYQEFLNSINMKFCGIGIYMEIVPEGVKVTSVVKGSPAENAGIIAGDIITSAGGVSLAGMNSDDVSNYIKGPEGSKVTLSVKRGNDMMTFTVTREEITLPTVEGEILDNHIGYIKISSFGDNTADEFKQTLESVNGRNPDCYIIDLRDNPGGYMDTAVNLAGYFIGDRKALIVKDKNGNEYDYYASDMGMMSKPVIFLINNYSASASEILSGAVKDYGKAFFVGNKTYGKGVAQSMFPLSDGSVLKLTVESFYSPLGKTINNAGISPDINTGDADSLDSAVLLSGKCTSADKTGYIKIDKGGKTFEIDIKKAATKDYYNSFMAIINGLSSSDTVSIGGNSGYTKAGFDVKSHPYMLLYPGCRETALLQNVSPDKKFTVTFTEDIDRSSITDSSIKVIDASTGEDVKCSIDFESGSSVSVKPLENLKNGGAYYIIVNSGIKSLPGEILKEGTVTKAVVSK